MENLIFYILAAIALGGGLGVIFLRNPVASALCLVVTLLAIACVYLTIGAEFLAAIQVLVYAGAIVVLFLFVILLVNQDLVFARRLTPARLVLPGLVLILAIGWAAVLSQANVPEVPAATAATGADASDASLGTGAAAGELLFTQYVFPFELVSVLLLAALIGAVVLAKKKGVN